MTVVTIESDSEINTQKIVEFVEALGLHAKTDEHRVLTDDDMIFGIGRPATDAELTEYFLKVDEEEATIDISVLREKYSK